MRRMVLVVVGASVGCGRIGFGPVADAATVYNDITDPQHWSEFIPPPGGGGCGAFDGQYIYWCGGLRYDTKGEFTNDTSWATFALSSVQPTAQGFNGAVFAGGNVYFVPSGDGIVTRYDTSRPFEDVLSWSTFDTKANLGTNALSFRGGVFDGRYVYLAPAGYNGTLAQYLVTRYDTNAAFADPSSWGTFDTLALDPNSKDFEGAVFDGRSIHLAPHWNGLGPGKIATRFDTMATTGFGNASSWAIFDTTTLVGAPRGFEGAAFDGSHVYLVPRGNGPYNGLVTRFDPNDPQGFASAAAWEVFDATTIDPNALGFATAVFDGRFVYFCPYVDTNGQPNSVIVRYDSTASFANSSSWSKLDLRTLDPSAAGVGAGVFDGRYIYLSNGTIMLRFDAKTPPSMPSGYSGSFY